jgi:hypothetical protein
MTLLNYSGYIQIVAIGAILLASVLMDRALTYRRTRREIASQLHNQRPEGGKRWTNLRATDG